MSSVAVRIWRQQIIAYVPHTSVSGETWQRINSGYTTDAGAAGGGTLVDTGNDSGGANTYNGRYYVKITSGANKGHWKRIVDDDGAGTLALENNGFPSQVVASVSYEIWKSPEPVVVVDSSGDETDMVDAVRTEADVGDFEYWDGFYAIPITGNRRGRVAEVTAFNPATGTFVLASGLGGALAAGDVVVLRKFVEADAVSLDLQENYHPRPANRTNFSVGDGSLGARGGTVGFNVHATASAAHAASGSAAEPSVCSGLFEAVGLEESIGTSVTVGAGSTTSAVKIATGSWESLAVGQMVVDARGNAAFITSLEDGGGAVDTVNVEPPLPQAPVDTETLYATRMYSKITDGDSYGVCIEVEVDGNRTLMTGCKGSVTLAGDDVLMWQFSFSVDHWLREYEACPANINTGYTSAYALTADERVVYLDTTKINVGGITATPGTTVAPKKVQGSFGINGRAGYQINGYACNLTCSELLDATAELTQELRWTARTASKVAVIFGSHANTVAVRLPTARHIQLPNPTDDEGLSSVPDVWEAQDAGTSTDGDSAVQKVPDFAIHIA